MFNKSFSKLNALLVLMTGDKGNILVIIIYVALVYYVLNLKPNTIFFFLSKTSIQLEA
jgi:hypothetical protein